MNKATVIRIDGMMTKMDHRPTLEEAQKTVDGYIEFVHLGKGMTLVVNEEGLMRSKPINLKATELYQKCLLKSGIIVGDVILLEGWRTVG